MLSAIYDEFVKYYQNLIATTACFTTPYFCDIHNNTVHALAIWVVLLSIYIWSFWSNDLQCFSL